MRDILERCLTEAQCALETFAGDPSNLRKLEEIAGMIVRCFGGGGRVLACGNGGSMADALHFAEEWTGRFKSDRRPYAALALGEPTHLTCVANDYGFEFVFARQVEAFGRPGDLLIVLSTSGKSRNLLEAAKAAEKREMNVVGLLGRGGGDLADHCCIWIDAPGAGSDRIQEIHMLCLHSMIDAAERRLEQAGVSAP